MAVFIYVSMARSIQSCGLATMAYSFLGIDLDMYENILSENKSICSRITTNNKLLRQCYCQRVKSP